MVKLSLCGPAEATLNPSLVLRLSINIWDRKQNFEGFFFFFESLIQSIPTETFTEHLLDGKHNSRNQNRMKDMGSDFQHLNSC